jgi:hypothetical protein
MNPDGDACCAVTSLFDTDGERILIPVSDSGTEKQIMRLPSLWFSTTKEDKQHDQMLKDELDALKEELAPLLEEHEKREGYKNN